jgi:hypothetical protein
MINLGSPASIFKLTFCNVVQVVATLLTIVSASSGCLLRTKADI